MKDSGVPATKKDEVLARLRQVSHAWTESTYNNALRNLGTSDVRVGNEKVQLWFEKFMVKIPQGIINCYSLAKWCYTNIMIRNKRLFALGFLIKK